jgi:hypothetical protein
MRPLVDPLDPRAVRVVAALALLGCRSGATGDAQLDAASDGASTDAWASDVPEASDAPDAAPRVDAVDGADGAVGAADAQDAEVAIGDAVPFDGGAADALETGCLYVPVLPAGDGVVCYDSDHSLIARCAAEQRCVLGDCSNAPDASECVGPCCSSSADSIGCVPLAVDTTTNVGCVLPLTVDGGWDVGSDGGLLCYCYGAGGPLLPPELAPERTC